MDTETRTCQNCKQNFVIESDDFAFYKKVEVPAPTWCPECRAIRRHIFWAERNLFRKKEALAGKEVFSTYPEKSPIKIYDHDYWWSDNWDPMEYGREYDFSVPFFEQFKELMRAVPWPSRSVQQMVNSDYCNMAGYFKNCYLCFNGDENTDCMYGVAALGMKDCVDFYQCEQSELSYEEFNTSHNYNSFFNIDSTNCRESWFLKTCVDCDHCFGCINLRHKKYHIFNEPYSKEDYVKKIKEFNLGSYQSLAEIKRKVENFRLAYPRKYVSGGFFNTNVVGEYVYRSKNVLYSYQALEMENVRYSQNLSRGVKDCWDYTNWGNNTELIYECSSCGENCKNLKFCFDCWPGVNDLEYSMSCHSSSNLFGCVGLRKKQYCILNKRYSKEEYEAMVLKIKKQMTEMPYVDKNGRVYKYGEFFPLELSPLAYNESSAFDYFPKTVAQVVDFGAEWREPDQKEYETTLASENIQDHINEISVNILKETIQCAACKRAFRLIERELNFYKRFSLPIPRLCFNCRHSERVKLRNPMKWYKRQCMCAGAQSANHQSQLAYKNFSKHFHGDNSCPREFETTYAPDRAEIIYCEECYNAEII
ncbi:MAG: hypothetical protein AAB738_00285 [Patescibacteria group bacterium]